MVGPVTLSFFKHEPTCITHLIHVTTIASFYNFIFHNYVHNFMSDNTED